jgi:hypothetical protein
MGKSSSLSAIAMMVAAGIDPSLFLGPGGRAPTADERRFLDSLHGEARRIWGRRVARGLSESESKFVKERLEQLDKETPCS